MVEDAPAPRPWLSLIGIGEDGQEGLSTAARHLLAQADWIWGGERHLAMVRDHPAVKIPWPRPFSAGIAAILAQRSERVCVLASGDPFCFGVGSLLAEHLAPGEYQTVPAPSSLSLAAARLGWAQQDCTAVTLHGRPLERIVPHLTPNARLLILSWDGSTPKKLADFLTQRGFGPSRLWVLEALGGPRERISAYRAAIVPPEPADDLNLIALEVIAEAGARILPRSPGLPDAWFQHDGQITKREIRALTLAALAPMPGALLWDVGAGSGSVGIEWMLAAPQARAIALEPRPDRAATIAVNALNFGVPDLRVIVGKAPDAFADLPPPDAIFVGGGGPEVIAAALQALPRGSRLVANAVTLESQAALIAHHRDHGGELIQIQIARAEALGGYSGWEAARPQLHWRIEKP